MKQYCQRYDVYYDDHTGEYIDKTCNDPDCKRCLDLPEKLSAQCNGCHTYKVSGEICQGLKTVKPLNYSNDVYLDVDDIRNVDAQKDIRDKIKNALGNIKDGIYLGKIEQIEVGWIFDKEYDYLDISNHKTNLWIFSIFTGYRQLGQYKIRKGHNFEEGQSVHVIIRDGKIVEVKPCPFK